MHSCVMGQRAERQGERKATLLQPTEVSLAECACHGHLLHVWDWCPCGALLPISPHAIGKGRPLKLLLDTLPVASTPQILAHQLCTCVLPESLPSNLVLHPFSCTT